MKRLIHIAVPVALAVLFSPLPAFAPVFAVPVLVGAFCRSAASLTLAGICSTSRTTSFAGT